MNFFRFGTFLCLFLSACGVVELQSEPIGAKTFRLKGTMPSVGRPDVFEYEFSQEAWRLCPKGWDQIFPENVDYSKALGQKLRMRVEDGTYLKAEIKCK